MLSTSVAPLRADKNSYTLIHTSATKLSLSYFPLLFFFYNLFLDKLFAQQIYEQIYDIFKYIYICVCAHDFTIIDRFEDFQRKLILFAGIVSSSFAARDIGGGHRFKAEIWRSLGQERLGSMWLRVFFFFFFF